ncbi:hypothetical protein FNZ07_22895 [Paraburkholderia megapolitana]|nr:hypothetical protein FNZ07_22895 [Paraburkholderia megapolitana]
MTLCISFNQPNCPLWNAAASHAPSPTIAMSMILDNTLSMSRTSVRHSSSVTWLRCTGIVVRMSEYPCTGLDKAALKFALQGRKISQNVSVILALFLSNFVRQFLPFY